MDSKGRRALLQQWLHWRREQRSPFSFPRHQIRPNNASFLLFLFEFILDLAVLDVVRARTYDRHACAMRLTALDLAIIVIYLVGVTSFGIAFRRGQSSIRDYFLGGRTAPWWALALSIVATETSTLTIIGTPALAFAGDLTFLQLVLGYLVGRIVIVLLFLPHYFRHDYYTAYEFIERRFGAKVKGAA